MSYWNQMDIDERLEAEARRKLMTAMPALTRLRDTFVGRVSDEDAASGPIGEVVHTLGEAFDEAWNATLEEAFDEANPMFISCAEEDYMAGRR